MRTLAMESAKCGVTVNYVAPGFVDTDMLAPFTNHRAAAETRIPVDDGLTAAIGVPRN